MYQKTCLLIDDDKEDQQFFLAALNNVSPSTQLLFAPDAESAKKVLREEATPDIIFLDLF